MSLFRGGVAILGKFWILTVEMMEAVVLTLGSLARNEFMEYYQGRGGEETLGTEETWREVHDASPQLDDRWD
jgi:DNA primase catalytic subunit